MWEIEISHLELGKYRRIRGTDKSIVEQLAASQRAIWDSMWQEKLLKEKIAWSKIKSNEEAIERSKQATGNIKAVENILKYAMEADYTLDSKELWETLKDTSKFDKPKPQLPQLPTTQLLIIPNPPQETDQQYQPKIIFLDRILPFRRQNKIDKAKVVFKNDYNKWIELKDDILKRNTELEEVTLKRNAELEKQYQNELKIWEVEELNYLNNQREKNEAINKRKEQYFSKQPDAIVDYCGLVLSNSEYPDYFPQEFEVDYNPETRILIVDYTLPTVENIPKIKEVKYIQSKDEFKELFLPESTVNKLYDDLVYQIALRTIHELYKTDSINALDSIVFNGWVKSIDKATGHEANACILSVQANRQEFLSINLANVDPKACFKNLKGVGSSKLHSLTPIAPILNISREDKRFISSYEVVDSLDESINIAAMDWQDFENLIRELFEKEFSQGGGEVKVTQASRDGGVDAIAFDPDPIRGGKIAIQAKRYVNTVGVAAVRDLYGTVINEGATKGILITTADYGPDAYGFAKGKPLTLLNGSNLLHLLQKHGHKAKIDLKEAKKILTDREKDSDSLKLL
jgi:restriction system protein